MLAPNDGPRASALLLPSAVAVCPVLALYAANCDQVAIDEAWRAMLFAGLIGLATGAYCRVAFGRGDKAAVVSCGLVAVFGSHGHIARIATWQAHDLGLVIVVVETLTLVMLVVGVARATRDLNAVTRGITMVTGALFASSLLVLLFGGIRRAGAGPVPDDSIARRATGVRHPDIY